MASKVLTWGVNGYPTCPLRGCDNDVAAVAELARGLAHFDPSSNLRQLLDGDATAANVIDAMRWLVDGVGPGEFAILHHSGHGATAAIDGVAQDVICPVDFDWTPQHWISADDCVTILSALNPAARLFWLADCCHSGNLDEQGRDVPPAGIKSFPPPAGFAAQTSAGRRAGAALRSLGSGGRLPVAFVSACTSAQTAADAVIAGRPCGAFTTYFLQALRQESPATPVASTAADAASLLQQNGYSQNPVASGCWAGLPFPR